MSMDFEDLKEKIKGPTVLAMVPFKDNDELNIEALQENIEFIIDGGISGGAGIIICPCGSGEYVSLSPEEHKMVVKAAVEVAGDEVLIVAGIQSCDYREAIKLACNAADAGAKCVMIPAPYYSVIKQEEVYRWYKLMSEGVPIGIMTYNQPWRNLGTALSVQLMGKLVERENIVSMKYGGNLPEYIEALNLYSERFPFIDNSMGATSTLAYMHGATGFITGPGVFWPEIEAEYWSLLQQHKYVEADKLHAKLDPFWNFFHGSGAFGASVLKAALEYRGQYGGPVRAPFLDLTKEQKNGLFSTLEGIGVPRTG